MTSRTLLSIAWVLWGILVAGTLYGLVRALVDPSRSPEVGRGLDLIVVGILGVVVLGLGALLYVLGRTGASGWVLVLTVVLAYPIIMLGARQIVLGVSEARLEREAARTGDFRDPALAELARAIAAGDADTLARLLGGNPPLEGTDQAGHDLLAYAIFEVCQRNAGPDVVRVLLEAGADPRKPRKISGRHDAVYYLIIHASSPDALESLRLMLEHGADPNGGTEVALLASASHHLEAVRLLVEHGADINRVRADGVSPLVSFISQQQWESALYLIEKGADLDITSPDGYSVDRYLKEWQYGVYGAKVEGWDRVREAIAARRAGGVSSPSGSQPGG